MLSVAITTKNRPQSLLRGLSSLSLIDDLVAEVLISDDSDEPVADAVSQLPTPLADRIRITRQPCGGYIVARNQMMRSAASEYVLSLDDDAFLLESGSIRRALDVLRADESLAAVAFAQANADGTPWPPSMQPARTTQASHVAAFIGFAVLLRRHVFLELGGYPERYGFYGEEKDFCLRALDAGHHVAYLPDARVAHVPDPSGRSVSRYLRHVIRNDCLFSLYNEPFPMMLATLPLRLQRYFPMLHAEGINDAGGFLWIVRDLITSLPETWSRRRPVRWSTIREWRRLPHRPPAYRGAETA
jgi:GT2 family glycosyltransferase